MAKTPFVQKVLGILFLIFFFAFLYKLLMPRINAFGCMDDCNNFLGGYFLLHNKQLFSQIFFNHAPFMAHLSAFVQWFTHPQNLHELILRHRQFGLVFALVSEIGLFLRFGFLTLPFALVYELSKFYLGGDRFLAEGYIVYPLCYLLGLVYRKFFGKKLSATDFVFSALSTWFVVFMREPYIPVVLLLYGVIVFGKSKKQMFSLGLFLILFLVTFFSYNPSELIYNVFTVNTSNIATEKAQTGALGSNTYQSFVYPFVVFLKGEWQFVRYIEIVVSLLFLTTTGYFLWSKKWQWIVFLWLALGLANLRLVTPGQEYYGAFYLLPWFALTLFATCLMLRNRELKWLQVSGFAVLFGLVGFVLLSKGSYVHDKIDQQTEFITNFGQVLQVGTVVARLSTPKNSLFVDGFDDMIYFVAHRYSEYPYSWYTSLMPKYPKYTIARMKMFADNPPDFYYGNCPGQKAPYYLLPQHSLSEYIRLYNQDKPSCLWVRKTVLVHISPSQWQKAGESLYYKESY